MDPSKKKFSLAAVALAAIAATCWLGLRGRAEPSGQPAAVIRQPLNLPAENPTVAEGVKPAGEQQPERSIKKSRGMKAGQTFVRKGPRRQGKRVKEKKVYPEA